MLKGYESKVFQNYTSCLSRKTSSSLDPDSYREKGGVSTSVVTEGLKARTTGKAQTFRVKAPILCQTGFLDFARISCVSISLAQDFNDE